MTPARWSLKNRRWDNTRVIVEAKGSGPKGAALPSAAFRNKGANDVKLKAPDVPGVYVLYIERGCRHSRASRTNFKVAP